MQTSKRILGALLLLVGTLASAASFAGGRTHVFVGVNLGYPAYWPAPYYYRPAPVFYPAPVVYTSPVYYQQPVVIQSAPQLYVQRNEGVTMAAPANYWYFCADANAYYPYVKDCPGGWQRVSQSPR